MAVGNGGNDVDAVNAAYAAGSNAIENNYLAPNEKKEVERLLKEQDECQGQRCDAIEKELAVYQELSDWRDKKFKGYLSACESGHQASCSSAKAIHYDLRLKWTLEGNEYYLTHKDDFKLLPPGDSVFHNYERDSATGEAINVVIGNLKGYTKYVHPTLGYEIVLDGDKNIVTDPLNMGTYNFYNPTVITNNPLLEGPGFFGTHAVYDVLPYYNYGNAPYPSDPTTPMQRKLRSVNKYIP